MAGRHKKTFYLANGETFSSLKGFAKKLVNMPHEVYKHHVNPERNDFANWIRHSLKHEELAKKIEGEIDKIELELHILRELLFPTKKPKKKTAKKKKKEA